VFGPRAQLVCDSELGRPGTVVRKPEAEFGWQLKEKIESQPSGDRIYDLHFVSQTWQENTWQHQLQVYQPRNVAPNSTMFLWVTGGSARSSYVSLGLELARKINAPVAILYNIPNQPLLESKLSEDDLIAETFVRYLKTKDENWPLLLPMVKGVVKAMDVLQAFGNVEWGEPINSFIVSGRRSAVGRHGLPRPSINAFAPLLRW
jgi:PhoPQ-activated pathogenicity-related protein